MDKAHINERLKGLEQDQYWKLFDLWSKGNQEIGYLKETIRQLEARLQHYEQPKAGTRQRAQVLQLRTIRGGKVVEVTP